MEACGARKCCRSSARGVWSCKACGIRSIGEGWVVEEAARAEPGRLESGKKAAVVAFGEVGWRKMLRVPRQGGVVLEKVRRA